MSAKNQASVLVEIAQSIYTFGCASPEAHRGPGDPEPARYTWAAPKGNPDFKRPLHEIRADIAAVFQAEHGIAPNRSALGDCMTVLEGIALKQAPITGNNSLLALLMGSGGAPVIVELAEERFDFGVTTTGEPYAVLKEGPNIALRFRGGRHSLRATLAKLFYEKNRNTAKAQDLADALLVLEGRAADLEPTEVAIRVGRNPVDGRIILDLGREDGVVVAIGAGEWDIVDRSPLLFFRTAATLPLPRPFADGSLDGLRGLLNISDDDWPLIVAWAVAALFPEIPHPVLALCGEQGTAKSTAARLLASLIDRCAAQLRTAPHDIVDWAVACTGSWVTSLDNISEIPPWLSDAICRAVTGDGLLRRELYTTSDVSVLAFRRVVALTMIDLDSLSGDLAERLLSIELQRIGENARRHEHDLMHQWERIQPAVLGGLLDLTAAVLMKLPKVRLDAHPRMADFARILAAVDDVLHTKGLLRYLDQARALSRTVAEADPVAVKIQELILVPWEGTASELLDRLSPERPPKEWPKTPQGMGVRLKRIAPAMRKIGWTIEQPPRSDKKGSRRWLLEPPDGDAGTDRAAPDGEEDPGNTPDTPDTPDTSFDLGFSADESADDWWEADESDVSEADKSDVSPPTSGESVSAGQDMSGNTDDLAGTSSTTAQQACLRCGEPLDRVLIRTGFTSHPTCEEDP
jgi:hypothetical protein